MPKTLRFPLVVLALAACDHTEPFRTGDYAPVGAFGGGMPVRLTFNPGADLLPSWLPDGSGVLYSRERLDAPNHDHCLSEVPAGGGGVRDVWCATTAGSGDSVDVAEMAAVTLDGRMAFVRTASPIGALAPTRAGLYLGPEAHPAGAVAIVPFPYRSGAVPDFDGLSELRWMNGSELLFLAERIENHVPCQLCPIDTLHTGVAVVRLTLTNGVATLAAVPGTDSASSYAIVGADSLYFTRNGRSGIYRTDLTGGAVDTAFDFGAPVIVRGVQVAGGRAFVVIDGRVDYAVDATTGRPRQRDEGGDLYSVTLATGADTMIMVLPPALYVWFRRPELAPDRRHLVLEGRPVTLIRHTDEAGNLLFTDTIMGRSGDIWRYDF